MQKTPAFLPGKQKNMVQIWPFAHILIKNRIEKIPSFSYSDSALYTVSPSFLLPMSIHTSVLVSEVLQNFDIPKNGVCVDATAWAGGHSRALIESQNKSFTLVCIDQDKNILPFAEENLQKAKEQNPHIDTCTVHGCFDDIGHILAKHGYKFADFILADLGVSSPQFDEAARGFSYRQDAPLDMRMDQSRGIPVYEWIKNASAEEISQVLWQYGEEKNARRIAKAIVRQNQEHPIYTTTELSELIETNTPQFARKFHPSRKSFQALRIFINDELGQLNRFLHQSYELLPPDGRLAIISFHSLEDKMVKRFFQSKAQKPKIPETFLGPDSEYPDKQKAKILGKWSASKAEQEQNPRSRSAILRVLQKLS